MSKSKYTAADKEAWLQENPWDRDYWEHIPDTYGFQCFVLGRRMEDVWLEIRGALDEGARRTLDKWTSARTRLGKWWQMRKLRREAESDE